MLEVMIAMVSYLAYLIGVLSVIAVVLGLVILLAHMHEVKLIKDGRERLNKEVR